MTRDAPPPVVATAFVYLLRHGETEWSASGRHTGRTDLALTVAGEAEARALRPVIAGIRFDNVFTSPALRARRTCELAGLAADAEIDPDLAEWDYGEFEGERSKTIRETRPKWMVYRDGCPGGESADDTSNRADRVITKLRLLGGTIALFSHGQFGCSLAVRWIGLPIVQAQHLRCATASFGILGVDPNHPDVPVIAQWNVGGASLSFDARPCRNLFRRSDVLTRYVMTLQIVSVLSRSQPHVEDRGRRHRLHVRTSATIVGARSRPAASAAPRLPSPAPPWRDHGGVRAVLS